LETDPSGASIWLNGDLRPEKTPATLSQLPVGTALAIKVTKEGFEQERATLSLTGATPEAIRLALRPETFALTLHVSPEGLHPAVTVDGKPILGDSVDHLLARDSHVVVVSAPGYLEQTVQVSGLGAETKAMDIALQKVPEAKAPPSVRPAPAAGLPAPRGPALNGKLHVSAFGGWCQVSVDGVPKGPTPIAGMELAAGPHRVTCTQEGKAPVTNTVNVVADSTVRFRFDL
jgi:serine/threonine-protein kinase